MSNVNDFIEQNMPAAVKASQALGVSPHVLLGQWGLETGWGKSVIPGTNNLGNIKDFSGGGVQATDNMTGSKDKYRVYDSPEAFGDDYAKLIGTNKRYATAVGAGGDANAYATALKTGGYAEDPHYVNKVASAADMVKTRVLDSIGQQIVEAKKAGHTDDEIAQALVKSPTVGGDVHDALLGGTSASRILEVAGGSRYQDYLKSNPTYGMSTTEKALAGAGSVVAGAGLAGKELWHNATGDEAALAKDRIEAEEKAKRDAPLLETTAGSVGAIGAKALPSIIAGIATGGASFVPTVLGQAVAGGVVGALTPTTKDGELARNIANEAVAGGVGGAVGYGVGKGLGWAAGKLGASPEEAAQIAAKVKTGEDNGLPVTSAEVSPFYRGVQEGGAGSSIIQNAEQNRMRAMAAAVIKQAGGTGDEITPRLVKQLGDDAYKPVNNIVANNTVDMSAPSLTQKVQNIASQYVDDTTANARSDVVKKAVEDVLELQKQGVVPGQKVYNTLMNAQNSAYGSGVDRTTSQALKGIRDALVEHVDAQHPGFNDAWLAAKARWPQYKVIEDLASRTNGTGDFTPRQLALAIKNASGKTAFSKGQGAMQDVASAAMDLYGPTSTTKGFVPQLGKALGSASAAEDMVPAVIAGHIPILGAAMYALKHAGAAGLRKLSTAPAGSTAFKIATGTTAIQKALASPSTRAAAIRAMTILGSMKAQQ